MAGQVVGINTAVAGNAQGIGFAIPIKQVQQAIDSYQKNGKIIRPMLGVRYVTVTPEVVSQLNLAVSSGALVMAPQGTDAVVAGSPAAQAGIKTNDIILSINGEAIDTDHSLASRINEYNPGDNVTLIYSRAGKSTTVKVTLGSTQ